MVVQYKEVNDQWFIQEGKAQAECLPPPCLPPSSLPPVPPPTPDSWPRSLRPPWPLGGVSERRDDRALVLLDWAPLQEAP